MVLCPSGRYGIPRVKNVSLVLPAARLGALWWRRGLPRLIGTWVVLSQGGRKLLALGCSPSRYVVWASGRLGGSVAASGWRLLCQGSGIYQLDRGIVRLDPPLNM